MKEGETKRLIRKMFLFLKEINDTDFIEQMYVIIKNKAKK